MILGQGTRPKKPQERRSVLMEFNVQDRTDYQSANEFKGDFSEMLGRKCDLCKEKAWAFCVKSRDEDSLGYLDKFGLDEGYSLVCEECFNKHFDRHDWRYVGLWY